MIHGIFYARFLMQEGSRIVHQSPAGCIVSDPTVLKPPEINFDAVTEYILPRKVFCNRYITVLDPSGKHRILGFPVLITDSRYERNDFMFNFGLVIPDGFETAPYESVVRRLAATFREMEIQNQYLSSENLSDNGSLNDRETGRRSIGALLEIIREDLNNYNECMIPVDDANTINMKLFPPHRDPPAIKSWHVPIATIPLSSLTSPQLDPTLCKLIPHIDGISDVRRIAAAADVSLELTKLALRHLLYYQTIIILDMFFFSNIYVPLEEINAFVRNERNLQDECARYVFLESRRLAPYYLARLYTSFQHGRTIKDWLRLHKENGLDVMAYVDVRRLVHFGVINNMLFRVKKYPISKQYIAGLITGQSQKIQEEGADEMQKYTDGCHSFDQIIVEQNMTDEQIMRALSRLPTKDVEILYR